MKKKHIFIIILLFFIIILFYHYFSKHNVESFSLFDINNITDTSTTKKEEKTDTSTTKKEEEDKFKFFKILPEYNKWSDETREAMKKKLKEKEPNLASDGAISFYETYATESEAKFFNENGEWPLNVYIKDSVKNFVKKTNDGVVKEDQKLDYNTYIDYFSGKSFNPFFSGPASLKLFNQFAISNMFLPDDLVGQAKFISKTRTTSISLPDKGTFNCGYDKDRLVPFLNSIKLDEKNYPSLENNIPGFKFLQKPCNPCENRCPFSYEGVLAAPYARYCGVSSQTGKTTPEEIQK